MKIKLIIFYILLIFLYQNVIHCKSVITAENLVYDLNSQPWGFYLHKEKKGTFAQMLNDEENLKFSMIKELPHEFDVDDYKYFGLVFHIKLDENTWYSPVLTLHPLSDNKKYIIVGYPGENCPTNTKKISSLVTYQGNKIGNICLFEESI